MSAIRKTIPPGKKAIITNTVEETVQVWTGEPPEKYCSLKPGDSCQIPNDSDSDLSVQYENNGKVKFDLVDFNDV